MPKIMLSLKYLYMNRYVNHKPTIEWLPNGWSRGRIMKKIDPNPDTIGKDTSDWPKIVEIIDARVDGYVVAVEIIDGNYKRHFPFAQSLLEFYYE